MMGSMIIIYVMICMCNLLGLVYNHHATRVFQGVYSGMCVQEGNIECVELWKCPYIIEMINTNQYHNIQVHPCGLRGRTPMICCPGAMSTTTMSSPTSITIEATTKTLVTMTHNMNEQDLTRHENYKLISNDICGEIANNVRITSGSVTELEEFPWMALLIYNTNNEVDFRCGGTLINNRYILTAAHCIENTTLVGVRLGEYDIDTTEDCSHGYCSPPSQDFYIEDVIIHTEFHRHTLDNDIALIRLATSANFTYSNIKPICLPFGAMMNEDLNGKFVIVTGWGLTEEGYRRSILSKVSIPVIPHDNCSKNYAKHLTISHKQICAGGYLGKDSCEGDSGGPLMHVDILNHSSRYIQYGIVSYGPKHCGANTLPGVYTRVGTYVEWILDNIKPDNS